MVRNLDEELAHREEVRKQFFEDPNYRKWSDLTDINDSEYGGWREDCFFECYLRNTRFSVYDLNLIEKIFQQGDDAPVNWQNFYDYFDAQLNDKDNRFDVLPGLKSQDSHLPNGKWAQFSFLSQRI